MPNQYLVITDGNNIRKAKCVCDTFELSENPYNILRTDFTATFTTYDYMMETVYALNSSEISGSQTFSFQRLGTAQAKAVYTVRVMSGAMTNWTMSVDGVEMIVATLTA